MPLDPRLDSSSSNPLPRSRAFIARFASPLASRSRNIGDFHIEPDDPWRTYGPGDTVTGCVVLTILRPTRVTHLTVCLHGYAKVFRNQILPGEGDAQSTFLGGRGRRGEEYHGNGFMSLFDDEVVLCGDGRLKEGVYKFAFELQFPNKALPSSIEFERGLICYTVSSTVTKPTTITPTLTCQRRIQFQDAIDIAPLPPQKPKMISLEPLSKKGLAKARIVSNPIDPTQRPTQPTLPRTNTDNRVAIASAPENLPPQSPAPSETSGTSVATESSQSFRLVQRPSLAGSSFKSGDLRSISSSLSENGINATVEVLRAGALPGDTVPIRISVQHIKPVRGVVIVTLYRQGRIDMHPAVPVGPQQNGQKLEYEDVYPKSRTGLGGLHFASGSPSSLFRKDLSQTTALMIVNPQTLRAEIKASIRLPEDVFLTIANVPGGMIDFKYHIEVVMDLCGKLGESSLLSRLSITNTHTYGPNGTDASSHNLTSNWADRIVDTDPMKRIKTVVFCQFKLVVGSRDSNRTTLRWADMEQSQGRPSEEPYLDSYDESGYGYDWPEDEYGGYYEENWADSAEDPNAYTPAAFVPPPVPEEDVDEKTRLRRAEQLLLPSQPPEDAERAGPSSALVSAANHDLSIPSAPYISDDDGMYLNPPIMNTSRMPTPHFGHASASAPLADTLDSIVQTSSPIEEPPPAFESSQGHFPDDDKRDLERARLLAQASAPPAAAEDSVHAPLQDSIRRTDGIPTAPVLSDESGELTPTNGTYDHELPNGQPPASIPSSG